MESLPIINLVYQIYKLIVLMNNQAEKRWRFTLLKSLEDSILSLVSELIMAKNAPKPLKASYLIRASGHLETSILKLRLCLELKIVNETKIFQAQAKAAEAGRMLGGWLKSLSS